MFLSIYYFFKGIKPMNNESQHFTLAFLARHAEKENIQLVEKCRDEVLLPRGISFVQETGLMPPELSRYLLRNFRKHEGNQGD